MRVPVLPTPHLTQGVRYVALEGVAAKDSGPVPGSRLHTFIFLEQHLYSWAWILEAWLPGPLQAPLPGLLCGAGEDSLQALSPSRTQCQYLSTCSPSPCHPRACGAQMARGFSSSASLHAQHKIPGSFLSPSLRSTWLRFGFRLTFPSRRVSPGSPFAEMPLGTHSGFQPMETSGVLPASLASVAVYATGT